MTTTSSAFMIPSWISQSIKAAVPQSRNLCRECLQKRRRAQGAPLRWQFVKPPFHHLRTLHTEEPRPNTVPLRKQLKDLAKERRASGESKSAKRDAKRKDLSLERWELTVGIEIHAQLNTERKLFSSTQARHHNFIHSAEVLQALQRPSTTLPIPMWPSSTSLFLAHSR